MKPGIASPSLTRYGPGTASDTKSESNAQPLHRHSDPTALEVHLHLPEDEFIYDSALFTTSKRRLHK